MFAAGKTMSCQPFIVIQGIVIVYSFDFSPQRHKDAEDRKGFLNAFNAERLVHGSLSAGHQIISLPLVYKSLLFP
jgi:hypothetical protein